MTEKSDPVEEVLRLHKAGRLAIIDVSGDKPRNLDGAASVICEVLRKAAGMVMVEREKVVEWREAVAPFCVPDSWSSKMIDIDGDGPRYRCAPDAIEPHQLHRLDRAYAAMIEASSLTQDKDQTT